MFIKHILENRTTNSCIIEDKCVEYVHITFPNTTDEVKTCGEEMETNTVYSDGYSGFYLEFYTNREEEDLGFSVNVMCTEPDVEPSRKKRQIGKDEEEEEGRQEDNNCVSVPNIMRPTVDSVQLLVCSINIHNVLFYIMGRCSSLTVSIISDITGRIKTVL